MKKYNKNNDIDNRIHSSFESFQPQLDNDELWENIEPHLKKKKKRRFFIWFFLGALGIFTTTMYFYNLNETNNLDSLKTQQTMQEAEVAKQVIGKEVKKEQVELEDLRKEQRNSELVILGTEDDKQPTTETPHNNADNSSDKVVTKKAIEKSLIESVNEAISEVQYEATPYSKDISLERPATDLLDEESKVSQSVTSSGETSRVVQDRILSENENLNDLESKNSQIIFNSTSEEDESMFVDKRSRINELFDDIERIQALKLSLLESPQIELPILKYSKRKTRSKRTRIKPRKKAKWQPQIQYSKVLAYGIENVSYRNGDTGAFLEKRNNQTSQMFSFGAHLKYVHEHKNGLMLIGGLEFLQMNERIKFQEETITKSEEFVDVSVTENAQGEIINSTQGWREVTIINTVETLLNNQYRFLNVPIGIGYSSKWKFGRIKYIGGLDYNLMFKFRGSILSNFSGENNYVNLDITSPGSYGAYYKPRSGFGIWGGVVWHYNTSERTSIVVSPTFQMALSSLTPEGDFYKQKLHSIKLNVGFNYILANYPEKRKRR